MKIQQQKEGCCEGASGLPTEEASLQQPPSTRLGDTFNPKTPDVKKTLYIPSYGHQQQQQGLLFSFTPGFNHFTLRGSLALDFFNYIIKSMFLSPQQLFFSTQVTLFFVLAYSLLT